MALKITIWVLRLAAAAILIMTLFFKFTADPQSVKLFTAIGMEPYGRIGIGILELIASILILYPRTTAFGAVMSIGLMAGAIFFHITKIGIKFDGDYGLFTYAVVELVCSCALVIILRDDLLRFAGLLPKKLS